MSRNPSTTTIRRAVEQTAWFRKLLRNAVAVLAVGTPLVAVCYFFVDRPVAFFVHERVKKPPEMKWLKEVLWLMTEEPMWLNALAVMVAVLAVLRRANGPLKHWENAALAASVSLIVAIAIEWYLKYLAGRYWPETWLQPPNASLIGGGEYGFHPFNSGPAYGSFPSGHTARVVAVFSVVAFAYPRLWRVCVLICASVIVGLVGLNYHFVGDTVGGVMLGGFTGMFTAAFFGLKPHSNENAPAHTNPS